MSRGLTTAALILAALGISLFLFPADSDGAFASFDGVLYGIRADRHEPIVGQHPLFHLLAAALQSVLSRAGVAHPGHVAVRVLSGIAAAAIVLLIARAAGARSWAAGAAAAAAVLATRSFMTNAAVGETVLPGCAAALACFVEASRPRPRAGLVWTCLVLALLIREDNVLIVPGVIGALAMRMEPGGRTARIGRGLAGAAIATLACYAAVWWFSARPRPALDWLLGTGAGGEWTGEIGRDRFLLHVEALSAAVVGGFWPTNEPNFWIGPGFLASLLAAGLLLRGRSSLGPALVAVASTVLIRAIFFTWYGAPHPKWSVTTIALTAWLASRMMDGEPRRPWARAPVAGALVVLAAAILATHARFTWPLRERNFIAAMSYAAEAGRGCRFVAHGPNVDIALWFLEVPHTTVQDWPDPLRTLADVAAETRAQPGPTMIVTDRWALNPSPHGTATLSARHLLLDDLAPSPELSILSWNGRRYAVKYVSSESRPVPR